MGIFSLSAWNVRFPGGKADMSRIGVEPDSVLILACFVIIRPFQKNERKVIELFADSDILGSCSGFDPTKFCDAFFQLIIQTKF